MPQRGVAVPRGEGGGRYERYEDRVAARDSGSYSSEVRVPGGVPGGVPGRRTVTIRGQGAERYPVRRSDGSRRPPERRHERAGFRPDRAALWAVMLGMMLILVAVTSAHGATF